MTFAIMKDGIGSVLYTGEKQKKINTDDGTKASASEVRYMNQVEEGWRADGWYQIDGADVLGAGDDTDWYYFKDGKAKRAEDTDYNGLMDGSDQVKRAKIKIAGKYFCFNEIGQMQTGLQAIGKAIIFFFYIRNLTCLHVAILIEDR